MNKTLKFGLCAASILIGGCSYQNLDSVKENAEKTMADSGYTITAYQGYQMGMGVPFTTYGGAFVWYEMENGNGIKYQAAIKRWGDEYHIYNLSAVDAIRPTK